MVLTHGEGPYVVDVHGRRYLDACGGAAVSCLGHSHAEVIEAVREQAGTLAFAYTGFFTSAPAESLAEYETGHDGTSEVWGVQPSAEPRAARNWRSASSTPR